MFESSMTFPKFPIFGHLCISVNLSEMRRSEKNCYGENKRSGEAKVKDTCECQVVKNILGRSRENLPERSWLPV